MVGPSRARDYRWYPRIDRSRRAPRRRASRPSLRSPTAVRLPGGRPIRRRRPIRARPSHRNPRPSRPSLRNPRPRPCHRSSPSPSPGRPRRTAVAAAPDPAGTVVPVVAVAGPSPGRARKAPPPRTPPPPSSPAQHAPLVRRTSPGRHLRRASPRPPASTSPSSGSVSFSSGSGQRRPRTRLRVGLADRPPRGRDHQHLLQGDQ